MFIVGGDGDGAEGFVMSKPNVYVVPADIVKPVYTDRVKVPEFHAPFPCPCAVPSEKIVSPSSPLSISVTGLETTAPVRPEIVTTELPAAVKAVSVTSVTVIVFVAPAYGVLCPIALVVNDCAKASRQRICMTTSNATKTTLCDGWHF